MVKSENLNNFPGVAIIVLNWNGWRDTIECLESLQRLTYPNYQVIVVDNGSTDDSIEKLRAWARGEIVADSKFFTGLGPKPVTIIEYSRTQAELGGEKLSEAQREKIPSSQRIVLVRNSENLGFAAGNNVGIRYALKRNFDYIALLNNDTVVDPQCMTHLVDTLESRREWVVVSPKILYKDDPGRIWYAGGSLKLWRANAVHTGIGRKDDRSWSGARETGHCSGCCPLVRRSLFETVGLLDEDFFFAHEDVAFSSVVTGRGLKMGVDLDAKIYHKSGGSSGTGHPIYVYYYNKNRLLILKKYGSLVEKVLGFSFYALTRPFKFLLSLIRGKAICVGAELLAIRDFLLGRYGEHDRWRANSHG
ncbi:glycosyltransferase family 2 protein [Calderihabitans maritimus]|uniref:Rhamnosyl transferase related protein n=1 Tax=Calderihabitans maritimus TaxID=1246530 RepID=A0A1Z5HX37_9FIRM|nr:glycosyltransferase family 2 protein [Calderihabitans maritimus]GAW94074.1 rhamnosyl transferase related protein [Calderihabitans maritimus]